MLLTIKFLESKLKEAETAIAMYATMLAELAKVQKELEQTKANSNFLKVVTNKNGSESYEN